MNKNISDKKLRINEEIEYIMQKLKIFDDDLNYIQYQINNDLEAIWSNKKDEKSIENLQSKLEKIQNQIPDFNTKVYEQYKEYFETQKKIVDLQKEEQFISKIKDHMVRLNENRDYIMSKIKQCEETWQELYKEWEEESKNDK